MSVLNIRRGDTATFTIALTDSEGAPLDLTGLELTFTAKSRLHDADEDALVVKTVGEGIEVDEDPTTGIATLTILPEDTLDFVDAYRLVWDLQVDNGAGEIRTPLTGRLVVSADVTITASVPS
jgi:hypothetical protein